MSNSGFDLSRAVRSDRYKFIYNCTPWIPYAPVDSAGGAGWTQVGGTSAGAPQWAALIAIADQGRALAGLGSLANAQAAIYSLSAADFQRAAGRDRCRSTFGHRPARPS